MKTFSARGSLDELFVARIAPYLKPRLVPAGEVIYRQGDLADGLYIIESGVLRVAYTFADHVPDVVESCVAGTLSGELSALAGEPRNATVIAERQSVLWKMSIEDLTRLEHDHPEDARLFIKLVLKSMFCSFSIINDLPNLMSIYRCQQILKSTRTYFSRIWHSLGCDEP